LFRVRRPLPLLLIPPEPVTAPVSSPVPPLATLTTAAFSNATVPDKVAVPLVLAKSMVRVPAAAPEVPVSALTVIFLPKLLAEETFSVASWLLTAFPPAPPPISMIPPARDPPPNSRVP